MHCKHIGRCLPLPMFFSIYLAKLSACIDLYLMMAARKEEVKFRSENCHWKIRLQIPFHHKRFDWCFATSCDIEKLSVSGFIFISKLGKRCNSYENSNTIIIWFTHNRNRMLILVSTIYCGVPNFQVFCVFLLVILVHAYLMILAEEWTLY